MRALTVAIRMACSTVTAAGVAGCPGATDDLEPMSAQLNAELRIEGEQELTIVAGAPQTLSVRYLTPDREPVAGKWVEFGLTGSAEGASLEMAGATTDADGFASTTLTAGRAAPGFQVRASAPGALPVFFDVLVIQAKVPELNVTLTYAGKRPIASSSVLLVEGVKCAQLNDATTDIRSSNAFVLDQPRGLAVGAGRSYAIVAWGSDETNSKLARGCVDYEPSVDGPSMDDVAAPIDREIRMTDLPFSVTKDYPVGISLDLRGALSALAPLARSAVTSALPSTSTPQASFLLDALQTKVSFAAARQAQGLDGALQGLLDLSLSGPVPFADALSAAASDDGASCLLQAALTPANSDMPGPRTTSNLTLLSPIYAIPNDSVAKEVSLSAGQLKGVLAFSAPYDQSTARVTIETLQISLGFGSYAAYLLDAVGSQPQQYRERVLASTGCTELGVLVSARPSVFGGLTLSDAMLVCEQAIAALGPRIRDKWIELDGERNIISLTGTLAAHDRNGNREIDDLGPATLRGTWSSATAAPGSAVAIDASVRMSTAQALR